MSLNPYAPPTAAVSDVITYDGATVEPPFFPVSPLKLAVMAFCTFGLYQLYWFYKQWDHIASYQNRLVSPLARAFFSVVFCYSCFASVRDFAHLNVAPSRLPAAALTAAWILLTVASRLPDPYWLVTLLSFVPMLAVQRRANAINASVHPDHDRNASFSALNYMAIVLGGGLILLATVVTLIPVE